MKKISIIVITRNSSQTINMCLDKITQQTYQNKELLVIDMGSIDNTVERAQLKLNYISYAKVLSYPSESLAEVRKHSILLATGDYLLFVLPTDELNRYACEIMVNTMMETSCDLVIGSQEHLFFKGYYPSSSFMLQNEAEALSLHYLFMAFPTITAKLYKRELLSKIDIPDIPLHEEILNLKYVELAKKVTSISQIIIESKEHINLFNSAKFWENQSSFWFKSRISLMEHRQLDEPLAITYAFLNLMEHLLFELIGYKRLQSSFEEISMEILHVFASEEFMSIAKALPHTGMRWKINTKEHLLTNAIAFTNFILHHTDNMPMIFIFKTFILVFIKLFYQQIEMVNLDEFLGRLQENMNIHLSDEAKYLDNIVL